VQFNSVSNDKNAVALAGLRIAVGIFFLIFGEYKVFGTQFTNGGFEHWINQFISGGAYPFMVPLLQNFVLAHARIFAYLVAYGEFAIGLGLVLGVLVRAASCFGFVFMLSLLFSSAYPGPGAAFWQYFGASLDTSVFALCFATFIAGESDRVLSLRAYLRKRKYGRSSRQTV
jgi:thiosulfate dehydrogenase (quinone) large subunit